MKLLWQIDAADVERARGFVALHRGNAFVQHRIKKNLAPTKPAVTKAQVWQEMVACLLTTQQRSGPQSHVTRFIKTEPSPLSYDICREKDDLNTFALETLIQFGGIRRTRIIAREVAENYAALEKGLWEPIMAGLARLQASDDATVEREVAREVAACLRGFGPKQSRNLLQGLGLTRYEIPIDSRLIKKLPDFGFPITLSAALLSDPDYYEFVLDGIQQLCLASKLFPCELDAAIFASFDGEQWTEENVVW